MPDVRRRVVFYIPGFDPFPARRYRELYRSEGAQQSALGGYHLKLSPGQGPAHWQVETQTGTRCCTTEFRVLVWSDLVQTGMSGSVLATYGQLVRTVWIYVTSGALWGLMSLRKGPVIAALYPVAVLLVQALLAVCLAWAGVRAGALLLPGPGSWIGGLLGAAAGMGWLTLCRRFDRRIYAWYLMHDYAFSASYGGATPPELQDRLTQFSDQIAAALAQDTDEVLVVGHSSGAHLGVQALAAVFRQGQVPENGPALGFLSLGQVIPMVSFLPRAHALRSDLQALAQQPRLTWVDVTAPGDGCCFALCDPVAVSGVAPKARHQPLVFSAQFSRSLSAEYRKRLRWRFFRLHFQYLCAFDQPLDYDYFQITAGPETLSGRYANRPPSNSRITRAVSPHQTVIE